MNQSTNNRSRILLTTDVSVEQGLCGVVDLQVVGGIKPMVSRL